MNKQNKRCINDVVIVWWIQLNYYAKESFIIIIIEAKHKFKLMLADMLVQKNKN